MTRPRGKRSRRNQQQQEHQEQPRQGEQPEWQEQQRQKEQQRQQQQRQQRQQQQREQEDQSHLEQQSEVERRLFLKTQIRLILELEREPQMQTHSQATSSSSHHHESTTVDDDTAQSSSSSNRPSQSSFYKIDRGATPREQQQGHRLTTQMILTPERPRNMIHILDRSMIHGRRLQIVTDLPNSVISLFSKDLKTHDYPFLIKRLDQLSVTINMREGCYEYKELVNILKEIEIRLVFFDPTGQLADRMQYRDEFDLEIVDQKSVKAFQHYNGIQILKRILLMSFVFPGDRHAVGHSVHSRRSTQPPPIQLKSWYCGRTETDMSGELKQLLYDTEPILKIKFKCINIFNRLVCLPKIGKAVAHDLIYSSRRGRNGGQTAAGQTNSTTFNYDTVFLEYLFTLFKFDQIRNQVAQLLESIVMYVPAIDLTAMSSLGAIIASIDPDGLLSLCKVFAVALSNLENGEGGVLYVNPSNDDNLTGAAAATRNNTNNAEISIIRDANQKYLVGMPNLVARIVELVNVVNYDMPARSGGAARCELERWLRAIDEALSEDDDLGDEEAISLENRMFQDGGGSGGQQNLSRSVDIYQHNPGLVAANRINNFVYALFTLNMFLVGQEKDKVIAILKRENFSVVLNSLLDHLIWTCDCEQNQQQQNTTQPGDQVNNPDTSHTCPEISIKIQLLRLVNTLVDEFDFKKWLMSREELEELNRYKREEPACLRNIANNEEYEIDLACTDSGPGLITKLAIIIKQQPPTAKFRFWLLRCVESCLRFLPSHADRLFLTRRGLVEDMVQTILALNPRHSRDLIQTCFDLLAELLKFNPEGFIILDRELAINPDNFASFISIITKDYYRTNLFIRSVMLSGRFFKLNSLELNLPSIDSNLVINHFAREEIQVAVLYYFVKFLSKSNIGPHNISCLNTAILILVMAHERQQLASYLRELKKRVNEYRTTLDLIYTGEEGELTNYCLLSCLKDLLTFWLAFYFGTSATPNLSSKLESTSLLPADMWRSTVELLLSKVNKNADDQLTLTYYIENRDLRPIEYSDDDDENRDSLEYASLSTTDIGMDT